MRPQQNRRMRGRGNNNRRGANPLTWNYESNGPDVKIRGNAQHIADKYTALARDAQASGDRVMAENYLQHAEHYMRMILSAQTQIPQLVIRNDIADYDTDETGTADLTENESRQLVGSGPQPVIESTSMEIAFSTNISSIFDADSGENQPMDRPHKPIRRRLPRRKEAAVPDSTEAVNGHKTEYGNSDKDNSDAETEVTAKPRRGQRSVKTEKIKGAEQADA